MDNVFLTMNDFPDLFLEMLVFVGLKMDGKKNRFLLQQTVERLQVNTFHLKIGHSMPIENIVRAFWGVLLSSQGETCGS